MDNTTSNINYKEFKRIMKDKGMCLEGVAQILKVDRGTLYRKLKQGKRGITLQNYLDIKELLELTPTEAKSIFGEV